MYSSNTFEHLLCVRHHTRHLGYVHNIDEDLNCSGVYILLRETIGKPQTWTLYSSILGTGSSVGERKSRAGHESSPGLGLEKR